MSLKKKELDSNFSLNEDFKKEVSKSCCSHEPLENKSIFQHFDWIGRVTPCFHVNGNQIKILHHPKEFYEALNVCNIAIVEVVSFILLDQKKLMLCFQ